MRNEEIISAIKEESINIELDEQWIKLELTCEHCNTDFKSLVYRPYCSDCSRVLRDEFNETENNWRGHSDRQDNDEIIRDIREKGPPRNEEEWDELFSCIEDDLCEPVT